MPLSFHFLLGSVTISVLQLPAFKHGSNILNESVAACLYLEVEYQTMQYVTASCFDYEMLKKVLFSVRASLKPRVSN